MQLGKLLAADKVKAHVPLSQVAKGVQEFEDYLGNNLADAFAGAAAWLSAEDEPTQCFARRHAALAFSACMRIAFVESRVAATWAIEREWQILLASEPLASQEVASCIQQILTSKGHQLYQSRPSRFRCRACHKEKSFAQGNFWMANHCLASSDEKSEVEGRLVKPLIKRQAKPTDAFTFGVEHKNHRIVSSCGAFLCVRCRQFGALDEFALCEEGSTNQQGRGFGTVFGDLMALRKAQRAESQANRLADRCSLARGSAVLGTTLRSLKGLEDTSSTAGPPPFWIRRIDSSHSDIKFGAGMVFCNLCGALSSSDASSSHLFRTCRYKRGSQIPTGSRSRLWRIRQGMHPEKSMEFWPDGRPGTTRITMRSFWPWPLSEAQPQSAPQPRIIQECGWIDPPSPSSILVSEHLLSSVFKVCNQLADHFENTEMLDVEVLSSLNCLNATPPQIAEAINRWFGSSFFHVVIDQLLEKSFQFEVELGEFVSTLVGHLERPCKRARSKQAQPTRL
jgi:hypothetical protein